MRHMHECNSISAAFMKIIKHAGDMICSDSFTVFVVTETIALKTSQCASPLHVYSVSGFGAVTEASHGW